MVREQGSLFMATIGSAFASFPIPHFPAAAGICGSSSPAISPLPHPTLQAFHDDLTLRLDRLMHSTELDGSHLTLPWLSQALSAALNTNSTVEGLIPAFHVPNSEREDRWVSEYMDDSAKLLDVCNILKERISATKEYHLQLQFALDLLDARGGLWPCEAKFQRARNAIQDWFGGVKGTRDRVQDQQKGINKPSKRLKSCNSSLRRMADKLATPTPGSKPFISAIQAAKANTIFVCSVLEAALTVKPRHPLCSLHLPSRCIWSASLMALQQRVKEEINGKEATGSSFLLQELTNADVLARQLYEILDSNSMLQFRARAGSWNEEELLRLRALVENLRKRSAELETGLGQLEHQMNELFRMLVNSRVALLDLISHSRS